MGYSTDRSGPVSDGPLGNTAVRNPVYREAQQNYPCYQDELGSWLSSITGIHISKKGVSIGGGIAKLPTVTLSGKGPPGTPVAPLPLPAANLLPSTMTMAGSSPISPTLLLGGAALLAVFMMTQHGGRSRG